MHTPTSRADRRVQGSYYTPGAIAEFLAAWVTGAGCQIVLEPAAGDGAFLRALKAAGADDEMSITAVEKSPDAAALAAETDIRNLKVIVGDFLSFEAEPRFDAVLGNPPWARGNLIGHEPAALSVLRTSWSKSKKPSGWEPYWYDVLEASRAIALLSIPNSGTIVAALGSATNPINDLRPLRNYCAHRLPNTAQRVDAMVASMSSSMIWAQPRDVAIFVRTPPAMLFAEWKTRFSAVSSAAVQ